MRFSSPHTIARPTRQSGRDRLSTCKRSRYSAGNLRRGRKFQWIQDRGFDVPSPERGKVRTVVSRSGEGTCFLLSEPGQKYAGPGTQQTGSGHGPMSTVHTAYLGAGHGEFRGGKSLDSPIGCRGMHAAATGIFGTQQPLSKHGWRGKNRAFIRFLQASIQTVSCGDNIPVDTLIP